MHGGAVLLLTLVAGYWVLERAEQRKGQLKRVGMAIGATVIVLSMLGIVCQFWCMGGGTCPIMKGGAWKGRGMMSCPFHPKTAPELPEGDAKPSRR